MLKQVLVSTAVIAFGTAGSSHAQSAEATTRDYSAVFADVEIRPASVLPTDALLTQIMTWLSANFDLPAAKEHPRIEFVTPARMAAVRYRGLASDREPRVAAEAGRTAPPEFGQEVYALYDISKKTIYLHTNWNAASPADVSVLVHELVHHLQNAAGMKFACPQEREKDAYNAQRAWLALFNRTLEQEFEIDPMTVLVRTNCGF
jgi:hypothetical protein